VIRGAMGLLCLDLTESFFEERPVRRGIGSNSWAALVQSHGGTTAPERYTFSPPPIMDVSPAVDCTKAVSNIPMGPSRESYGL
jgi:hypothetical protein